MELCPNNRFVDHDQLPLMPQPWTRTPEAPSPQTYGLTKPIYDFDELLSLIPLKRTKIFELIRDGKLQKTKCGRRTIFLAQDVAAFLWQLQQGNL
ncbi:helix-turn-helix domain-containing protein [Magnetospirillum sp. 15-1]|uniref:helix-turn-helix domain-containing protein n=1 Tax=Magnetospirillum sp. 15-1 TaxID=1979370 RepID=UPI0011447E53|nr:helix-turn-helix domain-containing protein [Magnetospirillum sp. 15-1]